MILFVSALEKGRGGGHLVRCTKLVKELNALGKQAILHESADLKRLNIELIVLDRFQTPKEELTKWKKLAPCVIGIDEGGKQRDEFDFLIDILPNLEKVKPNIKDIGLLPVQGNDLTQRTRRDVENTEKETNALISFGLEDRAGLGKAVFESLSKEKNDNLKITFLNSENKIDNLAQHLHEYDLVITHFGITAFEATYAGTPVLLINPTKYHEKLSKKAGFKTTTIKKIKHQSLRAFATSLRLPDYCACPTHCETSSREASSHGPLRLTSSSKKSLAELISSFSPHVNRYCPVCTEEAAKHSIARFKNRTYRKCTKCKVIFMDRLTPAPITYGKEYFFEEYKKQYGKTYIEDFPNLVATAKKRLKNIKKFSAPSFANKSRARVLDIGCAYGAFLQAAKEEDFEPYGIDPCKEAVEYVKEKLEINTLQGFFPFVPSFPSVPFNIITLWYTIEHFKNCTPVINEIKKLLSPHGVLALSTPSYSGICGKKNLRKFLKNSPSDHYTVWSPASCKKALSLHGFKVKKIINTGHHPERFPLLGKLACCKFSPIYWFLLAISKLFKLGDTFEVYAILKS